MGTKDESLQFILTNKLDVWCDREKFVKEYAIISYRSECSANQNLAYDRLMEADILSVAGIWGQWGYGKLSQRFFVLVRRKNFNRVDTVLQQLARENKIYAYDEDDFWVYPAQVKNRIIAELAIFSIGQLLKNDGSNSRQYLYNYGSLIVCSWDNFGVGKKTASHRNREECEELIALNISLDKFCHLIASTETYSHPLTLEKAKKQGERVFVESEVESEQLWDKRVLKPVSLSTVDWNKMDRLLKQNQLWIKKTAPGLHDKKNVVPHLEYNPDYIDRGKQAVLHEVIAKVSNAYVGLLKLSFNKQKTYFDELVSPTKTGDALEKLIRSYLKDKTICIDVPKDLGNRIKISSQEKGEWSPELLAEELKNGIVHFMTGGNPSVKVGELFGDEVFQTETTRFVDSANECDILLRICEEMPYKKYAEPNAETWYIKGAARTELRNRVVQHITYTGLHRDDALAEAEIRRILLDLIVKDCNRPSICRLPQDFPREQLQIATGWVFIRYRVVEDKVYGATLTIRRDGGMEYRALAPNNEREKFREGLPVYQFAKDELGCDMKAIDYGKKPDYLVMKKDGNCYLILNTEERPILPMDSIRDYDRRWMEDQKKTKEEQSMSISSIKNIEERHTYLQGYQGLHYWETDESEGFKNTSSLFYLPGYSSKKMKVLITGMILRVPIVRKVIRLRVNNPDLVPTQQQELLTMLKAGLGRWQELTVAPFPFKFLLEYLNDASQETWGILWKDVNLKNLLRQKLDK